MDAINKAFYVEAAINEEGPKKLLVKPDEDGFLIYNNDEFLCRIELKDEEDTYLDWKVTKGEVSEGVGNAIGEAIKRVI
ncbi:hypothetical protein [Rubrolithibacter danxiaensis]|uniref:hypothetical protein n=1 Tax=Rubrolithibacter danxiaensis TaxID=3390805 RepID=UPI003BF80673